MITVDHADPLAHAPVCHVEGSLTTITLKAPSRFEWEAFQVDSGHQLTIASAGGGAHASFHNVTTTVPAVISGVITADGAFTLQQAASGQIMVHESGRITAPAITLTTLRAADATGYLRTGTGRFDQGSGQEPLLKVEGNLASTGGSLRLIGTRLVQVGAHGKLEAPGHTVSVFAGPNASASSTGIAAAELMDGGNNIIEHLGIARGFKVEMAAIPDYDANLCAARFCGDQPGLTLGGEISANQVSLDTAHPFDTSVQNYTVGSLAAVNPNSGPGFQIQTRSFQPQNLGAPIDDDPPIIPAPIRLPGLVAARPATSQPLTVTYSHLNAAPQNGKAAPAPAATNAVAVRGNAAKSAKKAGNKPVTRGSFFGIKAGS